MKRDPKDDPTDDLEFLDFVTFCCLPTCGCGMPDEIVTLFRDALRHYVDNNTNDNPSRTLAQSVEAQRVYETSFKDERLFWLTVYALNDADLMEHGGSARVGWVTDRGKRYLALLEKYGCDTQWQQNAAEHKHDAPS